MEDPQEAKRYASEASALSRRVGFVRGEVEAVQTLVTIQTERGDRQDAVQQAREGVSWSRRSGARRAEAAALDVLVGAHLAGREHEAALRTGWEAMEIMRDLGDRRAHAASLLRVSMLHLVNSQEDWAMEAVHEATEIAKELEDRKAEARALYTLVHVHLEKNETKEALAVAHRAERLFKETSDKRMMASTLLTAMRVHLAEGNAKYAVASAQRAMGYFEEAADRKGAAGASLAMASVHFETQAFERALKAARRAQNILDKVGHMRSQAVALHMIAGAYLSANDPDEAIRYSSEMRSLCKKVQDRKGEGHAMHIFTRANLGLIWKEVDKLEQFRPPEDLNNEEEDEAQVKLNYGFPGVSTDRRERPQEKDQRWDRAQEQHTRIMEAMDKALNVAKEAAAVAKKSDDKELQGMTLFSLGQVQLLAGKLEDALKTVTEAVSLGESSGEQHAHALALILMGEVHFANQRVGEAVDAAERGLKLCKKIGDWAGEDYAKKVLEVILGEPAPGIDEDGADSHGGDAVQVFQGLDPAFVRAELRDQVNQLVGVDDGDTADDTPLMDSGMDSLSSVEFRNTVAKEFKMNLPATLTFDFPSIKSLTEFIVEQSKADMPGERSSGGSDGRSTQKSGIKAGGGGAAKQQADAMKANDKRIRRPCVTGTWDNWGVHEMAYDAKERCYQVTVRLGRNNWESFQIIYDEDWKRCVYPDQKDATPHAPHKLLGPDDDNNGKNWTVGLHQNDKGGEGVCFQIKLFEGEGGIASKVDWVRLGTGSPNVLEASKPKATGLTRNTPYVVGTMNNWGEPLAMTWTADGGFFQYRLTIGSQGWESFQILLNGEWRRCLHPDKKDGCPHSQYQLMGPDNDGNGKNWTIGRHPLDQGGPGVTYQIRLFMKGGEEGIPRSVDWVRA
uniref:Carrier domain-containing protein n=1 Tax=Pyrodinium bahamense TaxID=73915 RepID=A0A7S0B8A8_9DINO